MARKTAKLTIADENRDRGKLFLITEMSASQAEDWGLRALLALTNAGADVPDDIRGAGMAGVALMGIQALSGLKHADAKPLLDEALACVEICPDPSKTEIRRALIEDDIEEVMTRVRLRKAVLELHLGFSVPDNPLMQGQSGQTAPLAAGVITRTSPGPLV
jgi:hypothetical protein